MDYTTLSYALDDDIALITLNRPQVMNALNIPMRAEIRDAVERGGREARVVVLTGAGRGFCSGQDLSDSDAGGRDTETTLREEYEPMIRAIATCPVPVIAAVQGVAAGAGANLALAADVVIAAESASFLQAFARIGLIPDAGGTYWLPRQIGTARAMGTALFAEPVSARQAADWGMIWEAVPDADFDAHWRARAAHLAKGPTETYRHIKTALRDSFDNDLQGQLDVEAKLQGLAAKSEDFIEGVTAFLQKRVAEFKGR